MNFTAVNAQINRSEARVVELRASSFVILLCALSSMDYKSVWDTELTSAEWDDIQAWVANAGFDILTEYTCQECEECDVWEVDEFSFVDDPGDDGEWYGNAGSFGRDLNTTHASNAGNVSRTGNYMTPGAGLYLVRAVGANHSIGSMRMNLTNSVSGNVKILGINNTAGTGNCVCEGIETFDGTDTFYLEQETGESGYGGRALNTGEDETYTKITWIRLGDVPT